MQILAVVVLASSAWGLPPVVFKDVRATHHAGSLQDLALTIDGREASPRGWSVAPQFDQVQVALFIAAEPVEADLLHLTLFFMSGRPNASFAYFSISYTTDPDPGFSSAWQDLPLCSFGATISGLMRGPGGRLIAGKVSHIATGNIPDNMIWISARTPRKRITAFRVQVYPVFQDAELIRGSAMSWSVDRDFVLTEFRAEVISTTTNVALGAPVRASHPLFFQYDTMQAGSLTDGWPSTIAHPGEGVPTRDFSFVIDLGRSYQLDHINLRQRGDPFNLDRFSHMRVCLHDQDPGESGSPNWQVLNRADGTYPAQGETDVLQAGSGTGRFSGRYVKISSENPVPLSPMLAEVEVYETRTARLVGLSADEAPIPVQPVPSIPPATQRLAFRWEIPHAGKPLDRWFRWKLEGVSHDWQTSASLLLEIPCPPAGRHALWVQAAHSDGSWDASVQKQPFLVRARFTETAAFLWLAGGTTLGCGVLVSRHLARRKIQRLEAQSALAAERARIARNMHDDVGARIAQLAVLHDVFSRRHPLPDEARCDLTVMTECAREAMVALDQAVWTVNPGNDVLPALAEFLVRHATEYLAPLEISCRIDAPRDWPDTTLRTGSRHEVALAFTEALQNIVKHAHATEVELTLSHETGWFRVRLADNGCGCGALQDGIGQNGLGNMRQRLESIGGTIAWHARNGGGTVVELNIPLT